MVLAIGFNRVFRDERLPIFGFSIRTVLTVATRDCKGGIFPFTVGIGLTAAGMTNSDFTLRVPPGIGTGLMGFVGRASAPCLPATTCCWLLAFTFLGATF
jgi:hypothetical protein